MGNKIIVNLAMKFVLEAVGSDSKQNVIVVQLTPEEKDVICSWLETSLRLEEYSTSAHPLRGILEFQMGGFDAKTLEAVKEKFGNDDSELHLTQEEFGTLTLLADLWEDRVTDQLDEYAVEGSNLYKNNPEIRDYVLSDAYREEIKAYSGIVSDMREARKRVYPTEGSVD